MNNKEKLRLKFETWIALDNDEEMREEIIKLGREKYETFMEYSPGAKIWKIDSFDVDETDQKTIYFRAYYYNEDNTELMITIDELFSDTKEWVTKKQEKIRKAKLEYEKKERKRKKLEKIAFEKGEYRLYLELKEKFGNKAPVV